MAGAGTGYLLENTSNRLLSVGGTAYGYDTAGNLSSQGDRSFSYDARNRLIGTSAGANSYQYGTNALGQRVSKTSTALSTGGRVYVYDEAGHLLGEYNTTGTRIAEHIWLDGQPVAVVDTGGSVFPVLSDHLNTPRQIIDNQNRLCWRWDGTDPFGANAPDNNPQGLGAFGYNLRFPGQYYDSETGLLYNYYRNYDPKLGRYTQSDPVGLAGGINTYGYVNGNPVNLSDPTGLIPNPLEAACTLGPNPVCVGAVVTDVLTTLVGGAMIADSLNSGGIDWDEIQKDIDHKNYHRTCDRPPPPGLSPCELAKWEYQQAKSCYNKRKEWEDRWGNALTKDKHSTQLEQVKQRMANAANKIATLCEGKCEQ